MKHIAWIEKAFGATRDMVMPDPKDETQVMHAALQLNGGPIYLSDRLGGWGSPDPKEAASHGTHLYLGFDALADAEKAWANAVKGKGKVSMAFSAQFWGSHYGVIQDPFGTVWAISAPTPKEEEAAAAAEEAPKGRKKAARAKSPKAKKETAKKEAAPKKKAPAKRAKK